MMLRPPSGHAALIRSDREPDCLYHNVGDRLRRAGQVPVGVNADDHPVQLPQRRRRR